ncbi:hypothetical protein [Bacillus aerolatus]|nr:hypothetical protein [Bacillus aerolatus]
MQKLINFRMLFVLVLLLAGCTDAETEAEVALLYKVEWTDDTKD